MLLPNEGLFPPMSWTGWMMPRENVNEVFFMFYFLPQPSLFPPSPPRPQGSLSSQSCFVFFPMKRNKKARAEWSDIFNTQLRENIKQQQPTGGGGGEGCEKDGRWLTFLGQSGYRPSGQNVPPLDYCYPEAGRPVPSVCLSFNFGIRSIHDDYTGRTGDMKTQQSTGHSAVVERYTVWRNSKDRSCRSVVTLSIKIRRWPIASFYTHCPRVHITHCSKSPQKKAS